MAAAWARDRVAAGQRGAHRGGQRGWADRLAVDGATVAAGIAVRGSGAARVVRLRLRGLPQLWHASNSGMPLRPLGWVMLGVRAGLGG